MIETSLVCILMGIGKRDSTNNDIQVLLAQSPIGTSVLTSLWNQSIQCFMKALLTLVYLHHTHGCPHKCSSSKAAAVQRCQLVTTLNRHSNTGGMQKCMQTGN